MYGMCRSALCVHNAHAPIVYCFLQCFRVPLHSKMPKPMYICIVCVLVHCVCIMRMLQLFIIFYRVNCRHLAYIEVLEPKELKYKINVLVLYLFTASSVSRSTLHMYLHT